MIDEKNKNEIVNITVETVFETLRKNGFEIKEKKTTFQQTEQLLYLMPQLKEAINHNKKRIEDLHSFGLPIHQSGKGAHVVPENTFGRMNEDELIEKEINKLLQRNHIINTQIKWLNSILNSFKREKYYELIRLKYFENKNNYEIAEHFECDERTIRRNKNDLINRLKVLLFPTDSMNELGC